MRNKQLAFKPRSVKSVAIAPHIRKDSNIKPFLITKPTAIGPTISIQSVSFAYVDVGGTNNLLPGFISTQTSQLTWPQNAGLAIVLLTGFAAGYVDGNDDIVDHHLGELMVSMFFQDDDTVACDFLLRDSSVNEGVHLTSTGLVLYFQAV
jgi:hypothetical protein